MIKVSHLKKEFDKTALKDISLEINDGEVVSIIGPSGCGKSTFIRCLNLIEKPSSGSIQFNGIELTDKKTDLREIRKKIGVVSQSCNVFSNKMVIENVMMGPMDLNKVPKQQAFDNAVRILKQVGLGEKLYNLPKELSGGQRQRVAIARELAMEADVILFDEPTSSLDNAMKLEVQAVIRNLKKKKQTMVIISHDTEFCKEISDRVFFFDKGTVYEEGTPDEIFNHPKKEKTIAFIKQLKSLELKISSRDFDLYELNSKIEQFALDYRLSKKSLMNLELIIEEIVINSLLKHTEDIAIKIRYFETDKKIDLALTYGGESYDPFIADDEDFLSMLVVRQFTKDYQHRFEDKNYLTFAF